MMSRWALALLIAASAGAGCSDNDARGQLVSGRVNTSGAIAVRAVRAGAVITASQIRADGSFTLVLPANAERYRLEVLTTSGVRYLYGNQRESGAATALSFRVCQPQDPYDMGGIGGEPGTSGPGGGGEPGFPGCEDPMDPLCNPTPCDAMTDPGCNGPEIPPCADPTDPNCMGGGTPGCANPMDPDCGLPPTPTCDDPTDPYCFCSAMGECPPPYCGTEPGAPDTPVSSEWPTMCPPPPPEPCANPMDPSSCPPNPCEADPASCGCAMEDGDCWPEPQPPSCDAMGEECDPTGPGGMTPENPPTDFGCDDDDSTSPDDPVMPLPEPADSPTQSPPGGE